MPTADAKAVVFFRVSDSDDVSSSDTIGEAGVYVEELLAAAKAGKPLTTAVTDASGSPVKEGSVFIVGVTLNEPIPPFSLQLACR